METSTDFVVHNLVVSYVRRSWPIWQTEKLVYSLAIEIRRLFVAFLIEAQRDRCMKK